MKVGSKVRVSCVVDTSMSQYIDMTGMIIEVSPCGETVRVLFPQLWGALWFYLTELVEEETNDAF